MNAGPKSVMYPTLSAYIQGVLKEDELIAEERKELLARLATYIHTRRADGRPVALNFICTHNSRRSHLSQTCN